ncbi:ParB/RepB/Spo0J family partition protein [Streptomyces sp. NPDC088350]|uniref:ParB/RepB/Spo0J family partition protein n=1 Tax=Streptomyces sp. NPDC088350 TaxID=3365854 RepID=UPI00380B7BA8
MHQSDAGVLALAPIDTISNSIGVSRLTEVDEPKIVSVPIASLLPGEYPRSHGPDPEHVARLAEIDGPLPPILVRRTGMAVIDGMHRLLAAFARGQETIDVEFFDGSTEDAFLRAVEANVAHGLPLTKADRRAAATRIIVSHPKMSDRAIARASGLGAKAVASIRRRSTDAGPQLNARIGRDGRVRPLNGMEGRRRAAQVMADNPQASLREVARIAGISPATASDVRKRIQAGEMPAAPRPEETAHALAASPQTCSTVTVDADGGSAPAASQDSRRRIEDRPHATPPDPYVLLEKLLRDPSLRLKEEGRHLLRLLQQNATADWRDMTAAVPPHCGALVGSLARQYAAAWLEFAQRLDHRNRVFPGRTMG